MVVGHERTLSAHVDERFPDSASLDRGVRIGSPLEREAVKRQARARRATS
jgi:hypothetical protein